MSQELILSDEYLKALAGKFDLETIFSINLINKYIANLGSIPKCTSLLYLDLSHNNISSINGLENLVNIIVLDLSYNKISDISNLKYLRELENCKLQGNNISGKIPTFFAELKRLEKLTFYEIPLDDDPDVNTSNPICEEETYRKDVLDAIPQLKWLDGIPRGMEAFNIEFEENDNDLKEKLNLKNFNFSFGTKSKLKPEEIIPKENMEIVKKNIQEQYGDFQKYIDQIKKELEEIK